MTSNKPFPHIFSLISSSPSNDAREEDDNNNNTSSGYQTPRSSYSGSTTATPRSLFSTPPNSPPRPKSHIEERMKMRRYTTVKSRRCEVNQNGSENDDLLSNNMQHCGTDSSPRKNDLNMSPLQQRLARARTKREQILEERVQSIEIKSKHKEEMAMKNKEDVTQQLISKARLELAKSPLAKERRDKQVAQRVKSVEATIESKNSLAKRRVQQHLYDKQQRASNVERKDRNERRRKLILYEKRVKLLASLNTKLEKAALKSNKINEEKAIKAAEDVDKAKAVARRVKAARTIQSLVRTAYDIKRSQENTNSDAALSHHGAAKRLQRWFEWRVHISKKRLFGTQNDDDEDTADAIKALEMLLKVFPLGQEPPPFEQISQIMMQPTTLKMATVIVDCLRPINEVSYRSSTNNKSAKLDGRTLLALLLIAVHPREVLGDDFDNQKSSSYKEEEEEEEEETENVESRSTNRGSQLLALSSHSLLEALKLLQSDKENTSATLKSISQLCLQASELFSCWKRLDMAELIKNLTKQLEQSWFVYLTSSETLKYLVEVTGTATGDVDSNKVDDPLASLRLRHEASRSGSRSHIKRIRVSLNKLIGTEDGKEVVKTVKASALKDIEESEAMNELKDEINEIYGNVAPSTPELSGRLTAEDETGTFQDIDQRFLGINDEILSNRLLVHKILLTDPADFSSLSWNEVDAQQPNVSPKDFIMASLSQEQDSATGTIQLTTEYMPMRIAESMKLAFFNQMAQQMKDGTYDSVRDMLSELLTKMRSLLPNREDLHSHLKEEEVSLTSSTRDILRCLVRCGYLLSNYLESAARAPSTVELIDCLEAFLSRPLRGDKNGMIPYDIESEELFAVLSIAYMIHKTELCQVDISNYKLSQAAPLLHLVGNEYEVKHFKKLIGMDYSSTTSVEELKHIIPSTWRWVKMLRSSFDSSGENLTCHSNFDQKMDIVKGQGFVDCILFTRRQLILPEVLSLDVESISQIRSEARLSVSASALALHACSIAKVVGTAIPSSEADDARQRLSSVLRKKHFDQDQLESEVTDAIGNLTKALAERDLNEDESSTLRNRALAVLNGDDPVLKLLDNRVRSFFRFACKWKPDNSCTTVPLEMKTGRSVLKEGDTAPAEISTKQEFILAAEKEVLRLGFAYFGSDLIKAGNQARGIIALACKNYGRDILSRLLVADMEEENYM